MKIKSENIDGKIVFDNFIVIKESEHFFGVYERASKYSYNKYDPIITSGKTINAAAKKAKLLQIGYNIRKENEREDYY